MEAKYITITPCGKGGKDKSGWHTATLKAFDKNSVLMHEAKIDSFDTDGRLKIDFEPNGKGIRIIPYSIKHNALSFDEYVYGPTIRAVHID